MLMAVLRCVMLRSSRVRRERVERGLGACLGGRRWWCGWEGWWGWLGGEELGFGGGLRGGRRERAGGGRVGRVRESILMVSSCYWWSGVVEEEWRTK